MESMSITTVGLLTQKSPYMLLSSAVHTPEYAQPDFRSAASFTVKKAEYSLRVNASTGMGWTEPPRSSRLGQAWIPTGTL